jgi:hypothetical protein
MPPQVSPSRRVATAARWPAGLALTAWSYMWRTTVIHRRELRGAWPQDGPPPIAEHVDEREVQRPEDGTGPLFRRRYRARVVGGGLGAPELMRRVKADPNVVVARRIAHFEKVTGGEGDLRVGHEFVVRMPAPWDGPIRVVEVTDTSFRFATLAGHLEAGQIEWRARDEDGSLVFEIESWARAGDRLSRLLHDQLPMAKEVQLYMWTSVLERVKAYTGGELSGGLDIETRRAEVPRA